MKAALLKTLYNKAVTGMPLLGTPADVAHRFAGSPATRDADSDRLIALYISLSGATGFVCGLPGFLMLPLTLPTNLAGVALLQLHMTASLAVLGGHDPSDLVTRDACIGCLLDKIDEQGKNTEDEEVANRTAVKLLERGARMLIEQSARLAGKAARSLALRKLGVRRLPLVGGVLGASSDAYVTRHIGHCAKKTFLQGAGQKV